MRHLAFEKFLAGSAIAILMLLAIAPSANAANSPTALPSIEHKPVENVGAEIRLGDSQDGALMFKSGTSGRYVKAPMVETDVVMDIAGPIIRTTLSQTFENTSDEWVEGIYVFPLPENAAVDHLRMIIGGRLIEGQIKEKGDAKKIYEKAKFEGKKASLVEQERPNIFTASVANIGPRDKVAIQIEYQDKATIKSGIFSTRFPMTVAPRYSPKPQTIQIASHGGETGLAILDPVLDRDRISPPLKNPADEPNNYLRLPVNIQINLDAGFPISAVDSPYHEIIVDEVDADSARINLKDGPVPANRDFLLEWEPQTSDTPYSAIFKQEIGGDTYLLSMLTPSKPSANLKSDMPKTHARESIFVIDTSGSMGGKSIEQAKASLLQALDHLDSDDTFNIIRFSSDHSSLFTGPKLASSRNLAIAEKFVRNLRADGGTEMAPALKEALQPTSSGSERVRQILFITDGAIGNEQMLFATIKDQLGDARLFPIAIGSAPNSFFMSRAAKFGRGTFVQIGHISEVQKRMGSLFASLDNPVLTNLSTNFEIQGESYPLRIPDLYEGDPIISVAKLATNGLPSALTLQGELPAQKWKSSHRIDSATQATGISVLWARQKIADLEESRFDRQSAAEIDTQILQTALTHHIVSRLTSLVAVDITPSRAIGDQLTQARVPTQLPDGWDFGKLAGIPSTRPANSPIVPTSFSPQSSPDLALPATASPHLFLILLGLLLMTFGVLKYRRQSVQISK